ncbi:MAG: dihydroorotase [Candidatus Hydrothermales bacterium]
MSEILIKNVNIVDPEEGLKENYDILIENERIKCIERNIKRENVEIIEANNLYAIPGLVDVHTHLREPGYEDSETIETGTRAASKGGYVAVFAMPNTDPCMDKGAVIKYVKEKAKSYDFCEVFPVGAITKGRKGEELANFYEMIEEGAIAFSDDGDYLQNTKLMENALYYTRDFDKPIIQHAEEKFLCEGGVANESPFTLSLGLKGRPREGEIIAILRDITLLKKTKGKLHIAHLTAKESIEIVKDAKERGLNLTCEVTPHHLILTEKALFDFDSNFKVNPPLREEEDRIRLIEGLKEGVIDIIATDHAPHKIFDKEREFEISSPGVSGIEIALSLILTFFYHTKILELKEIVKFMSYNPAKIFGLEGYGRIKENFLANITILDLDKEWICEPDKFFTKGKNTPFKGYKLKGKVLYTIKKGKITYREDNYERKRFLF